MLFTNEALFGGTFGQEFEKKLKHSSEVTIATGYAGHETVKRYQKDLVPVASRGRARILVGMVYHSGVGRQQLAVLQGLNDELRGTQAESGVIISLVEWPPGPVLGEVRIQLRVDAQP